MTRAYDDSRKLGLLMRDAMPRSASLLPAVHRQPRQPIPGQVFDARFARFPHLSRLAKIARDCGVPAFQLEAGAGVMVTEISRLLKVAEGWG